MFVFLGTRLARFDSVELQSVSVSVSRASIQILFSRMHLEALQCAVYGQVGKSRLMIHWCEFKQVELVRPVSLRCKKAISTLA